MLREIQKKTGNQGMGIWNLSVSKADIHLDIPLAQMIEMAAVANTGTYSTTITWTLSNTPQL